MSAVRFGADFRLDRQILLETIKVTEHYELVGWGDIGHCATQHGASELLQQVRVEMPNCRWDRREMKLI